MSDIDSSSQLAMADASGEQANPAGDTPGSFAKGDHVRAIESQEVSEDIVQSGMDQIKEETGQDLQRSEGEEDMANVEETADEFDVSTSPAYPEKNERNDDDENVATKTTEAAHEVSTAPAERNEDEKELEDAEGDADKMTSPPADPEAGDGEMVLTEQAEERDAKTSTFLAALEVNEVEDDNSEQVEEADELATPSLAGLEWSVAKEEDVVKTEEPADGISSLGTPARSSSNELIAAYAETVEARDVIQDTLAGRQTTAPAVDSPDAMKPENEAENSSNNTATDESSPCVGHDMAMQDEKTTGKEIVEDDHLQDERADETPETGKFVEPTSRAPAASVEESEVRDETSRAVTGPPTTPTPSDDDIQAAPEEFWKTDALQKPAGDKHGGKMSSAAPPEVLGPVRTASVSAGNMRLASSRKQGGGSAPSVPNTPTFARGQACVQQMTSWITEAVRGSALLPLRQRVKLRRPAKYVSVGTATVPSVRARSLPRGPSLYYDEPKRLQKVITWTEATNARPPLKIDMDGPTPCTYSPRVKPLQETNAPAFTFGSKCQREKDGGSRTSWAKTWFQTPHVWLNKVDFTREGLWPSPAHYRKPSCLGPRQRTMPESPSYTFGHRTEHSIVKPGASKEPSPNEYQRHLADKVVFRRSPAFTHQLRREGTVLWVANEVTPGPAFYSPVVPTRDAPSFTIQGIRRYTSLDSSLYSL